MNNWTLAGIIALIIVICAGTIIKCYTHSKIKEFDGTYDFKEPGENTEDSSR